MMRQHDTTIAPTDHGQRNLQGRRPTGSEMRHAAIDADFGLRIETQAQPLPHRLQTMLDIGFEAFRIKTAEQGLAGEIRTCLFDTGELFAPPQRTAGRRQSVDETEALGRPDHCLVEPGRYRRIQHDDPVVQLRAQQRGAVMQHTAERMPYSPHRLVQSLELLEQLIE